MRQSSMVFTHSCSKYIPRRRVPNRYHQHIYLTPSLTPTGYLGVILKWTYILAATDVIRITRMRQFYIHIHVIIINAFRFAAWLKMRWHLHAGMFALSCTVFTSVHIRDAYNLSGVCVYLSHTCARPHSAWILEEHGKGGKRVSLGLRITSLTFFAAQRHCMGFLTDCGLCIKWLVFIWLADRMLFQKYVMMMRGDSVAPRWAA